MIRVVLVDDHAMVRSGLRAVLAADPSIEVVGEAANGHEAIELAERLSPNVVVMDLTMPELDGTEATKAIAARTSVRGAGPRILVLTMHGEEDYLIPLLEAGASGYLVKSAADRELVDAVRAVARGEVYVRPQAAGVLARGVRHRDEHASERARFERLTDRERDVLRLTAEGYTAPEIGERLFISPKTVDTYKQRINEKLGLAHRSDYVKLALRLGILVGDG